MTNIGINVLEVDGRAAPSVTGASVSVAAFNVLTRRGVPNIATRVTSFPQFVERFGRHFTGGYGAYLVKGFFDNGGQTAYVNRVVDTTPVTGAGAASRTLQDSAPANTLTLEAGFRGLADPGLWGREVFYRVQHTSSAETRLGETAPAEILGAALVAPVNMAALPALAVRVDGQATPDLTFAAADFANPAAATLAEIRDAINNQTTRLEAGIAGAGNDQIRLRSTGQLANGGFSSLEITAANPTLGFAVAAPVMGTPAALNNNGSILARTGDFAQGDALEISDNTTTEFAKLLTIDAATGAVTWAPNLANAALYDLTLLRVNKAEFSLSIATPKGDPEHIVEMHERLTMEADLARYAPAVLNHPLTGSRYVRADDEISPSVAGADRPAPTAGWLALQGGSEGAPTATHFIGDQATHTGSTSRSSPASVRMPPSRALGSPTARRATTRCISLRCRTASSKAAWRWHTGRA
jgi:hypothetical protein